MKGKWHGTPYFDSALRKWLITFEIQDRPLVYDNTKDKELDIEIRQKRNKRSLDANAYAWVLCTGIAERLGTSKDEIYEEMLQRYGTIDRDDNGDYIVVNLLDRIPVEKLGGHWKYSGSSMEYNTYMKIKGSSEMDSKEMSVFIDGVVSECKELGIETLPPDELERIKQQWRV